MKTSKKSNPVHVFATVLAVILGLGAQQALAAATYCSGDLTPTSNSDGQSTSDLTFNGNSANDCYGLVSGTDDLSAINALWGGGFTLLDKSDAAGPGASFQSLSFTLTTVDGATGPGGTWLLTVTDSSGGLNLPLLMDLVFASKASDFYAAYFFDNVLVDGADGGTYSISWTNNGGKVPEISHMSLYGRADGGVPPNQIPEPSVLLLMGAGLAGLGLARRRKLV